jgi:hypothetical protein
MLSKLIYTLALCATGAIASFLQFPLSVQHEGNSTGEVKLINGGLSIKSNVSIEL